MREIKRRDRKRLQVLYKAPRPTCGTVASNTVEGKNVRWCRKQDDGGCCEHIVGLLREMDAQGIDAIGQTGGLQCNRCGCSHGF